ncbi:MAG: hypothetical protein B6240_11555 [Desulfobacteraceae bacterium 4572_87]|nr:MAG: hypothetical protein B6240_11555 [Desulfobacteraceae bacterium 4572_87]
MLFIGMATPFGPYRILFCLTLSHHSLSLSLSLGGGGIGAQDHSVALLFTNTRHRISTGADKFSRIPRRFALAGRVGLRRRPLMLATGPLSFVIR